MENPAILGASSEVLISDPDVQPPVEYEDLLNIPSFTDASTKDMDANIAVDLRYVRFGDPNKNIAFCYKMI
jgi:hypothetical protein